MISYSIKDLERLSGIKAHTIRIWEKRYSLFSPQRSSTNIRTYSDEDLKKLLNISILNRNGYKISKISELSCSEINEKVTYLKNSSEDTDDIIQSLLHAMIDMDEALFEKIILKQLIQSGFEKLMLDIIMPFFARTSIMWQTNAVNPAQIHFFKNLVRQKLIVAIDSLIISKNEKTKTFLLYLPAKEVCEQVLLFISYILRKRGHKVLYLGACTPLNSIKPITEIKPINFVITAISDSMCINEAKKYIDQLSKEIGDKEIMIHGEIVEQIELGQTNITHLACINEFIERIDAM